MHIHQTPSSGVGAPSSAGDYSTGVRVISQPVSFEHYKKGVQNICEIRDKVNQAIAAAEHANQACSKRSFTPRFKKVLCFVWEAEELMPAAKHNGSELTPVYWKLIEAGRRLFPVCVPPIQQSYESLVAIARDAQQLLTEAARMLCAIEEKGGSK
jgi:hypothetical protein